MVNIANCLSFNFGANFYRKITTVSFDSANFTDKYEQIDNIEKKKDFQLKNRGFIAVLLNTGFTCILVLSATPTNES